MANNENSKIDAILLKMKSIESQVSALEKEKKESQAALQAEKEINAAKLAKLERELKEARDQSEKAERAAKEAEKAAAVNSIPERIIPQESIPYPDSKRKKTKYMAEKEIEFAKYGVGENTIVFETTEPSNGSRLIKHTDRVSYKGEITNLLYTMSHKSPFVMDHPDDIELATDMIVFERGRLVVPPTNPSLQRYLLASSRYGKTFRVRDEEALAEEYIQKFEAKEKAVKFVIDAFSHKDEHYPRYLAMHLMNTFTTPVTIGEKQLKAALLNEVDYEPGLINSFDPEECKIRYVFAVAHSRGLVIEEGGMMMTHDHKPIGPVDGMDLDYAFVENMKDKKSLLSNLMQKVGVK